MLSEIAPPPFIFAQFLSPAILVPAILFAAVTSITPGPNNMMLLASGVNFGLRRTLPHMLGITLGCLIMFGAIGGGLGYLFHQLPILQLLLMVGSFCYLMWMAWHIAFQPTAGASTKFEASSQANNAHNRRHRPMSLFAAASFQWINPKAWVMGIGFYANYIPVNSGVWGILAGDIIFAIVNLPCILLWVLLGANLSRWLSSETRLKWFNRTVGLLLAMSLLPILKDLPIALTMAASQFWGFFSVCRVNAVIRK